MGKVSDYISSLEGQENPNLTEVASKLLELHNEEIGTRDAKITTLESSLTEKDSAIAAKDGEIIQWKAKNWDLVNQIPATGPENDAAKNGQNEKPDAATIGFDDILYEKSE